MTRNDNYKIPLFQFESLGISEGVMALATFREGGCSSGNYQTMNVGVNTNDNPLNVQQNIESLSFLLDDSFGISTLIFPVQTHDNRVVTVNGQFLNSTSNEQQTLLDGCDALITTIPGVMVAVRTADCVPVVMYDSIQRRVAVVHAGWRGICNEIIKLTVSEMVKQGTDVRNLKAAVGVCISADVYEVGADVAQSISQKEGLKSAVLQRNGKLFADLKSAAEIQLVQSGLQRERIEISQLCTFVNNDLFYSYRRENGDTGRFLTGIALIG